VIAVVDYKAGNLTSVMKALGAVGADAELTDDPAVVRSADKIVVPGVGHFAGQLRSGTHDLRQPLGQGELAQRHPVRAKRVGRQNVGAGVAVVRMNLANQLRLGKTQLVEVAIGKHVVTVELGAHGTIEDHHAVAQGLRERKGRHGGQGARD